MRRDRPPMETDSRAVRVATSVYFPCLGFRCLTSFRPLMLRTQYSGTPARA